MGSSRHQRRLQKLLALLSAVLVLAACGGSPTAPSSGAEATSAPAGGAEAAATLSAADVAASATAQAGVAVSQPVEGKENITWWTHDNPAFVQANQEMIQRFQKENPNINVVYQYFPYDVFINKLQTGYASKTEPDIQQMFGTWVTDYAKRGLLAEMPTPKAQLDEQFFPAAIGAYTWEGKVFGAPHEYNLENGGMLVNLKMFKDAGLQIPQTWEDIRSAAKQLTKWNGDQLQQSGFAFTNNDSLTFMFLSFILQQGASYWDKDGVHVNFNTEEAKKAWLYQTGLEIQDKLTQERAYPELDTFDVFFQGKAAMGYRGPWVIGVANETYKDMKFGTDYDYVPVPSFAAGKPPLFAAESGWGEVVSTRSQHKDAAFKFIDFMMKPENSRDWNKLTFTVPALKALKNDAQLLQAAPALKTSFEALDHGQWVGPVQNRDRFWEIIHNHYTAVALGKEKPEDSLPAMTTEINAMIDEYAGP